MAGCYDFILNESYFPSGNKKKIILKIKNK